MGTLKPGRFRILLSVLDAKLSPSVPATATRWRGTGYLRSLRFTRGCADPPAQARRSSVGHRRAQRGSDVDLLKARAKGISGGLEPELSAIVDVLFPIEVIAEAATTFRD